MSTPATWVFFFKAYIRGVEVLKAQWGDCSRPTWAPSGHVGVQRGRMVACMASPCYANEHPQKHDDGGSLRCRGRSAVAFPAAVRRLLARNGDAFGHVVSSRCCSHVKL